MASGCCRCGSVSPDRAAGFAAVGVAVACFGRLDVVVNNAGYGQFGMVEELSQALALEVAPLRSDPQATRDYRQRLATWREWEVVSIAAQGSVRA